MNWPGFYALNSAWLFLLLIPLLLFYFLKLKRPRLEIPSLALWRQVINDNRVNSPFQRFRRNLLLLLQLIVLCLLILAAMQPFIQSNPDRAEYVPVLIDCSASMAATDSPDGTSRLDAAKEEVGRLIDDLLPDQQMSLFAFHSTARRLTGFTNNKRILQDALDKVTVVEVPSRIEDAMRLTQATSRMVPIEEVLMYTDGNIPENVDFELSFQLNYQQIPAAGANIGITAFNAQRSGADKWDVFVRVESSAAGSAAGEIELLQNGQPVGKQRVVLDEGQSERLVFSIVSETASELEVQLRPLDADSLKVDNTAYLSLPASRPLVVYVPPEMTAFRHALRAIPGLDVFPEGDTESKTPVYDLVISDRPEDVAREAAISFFVGIVPDDLQTLIDVESGAASVVDWQRGSPLLQHVQLADVQATDEPRRSEGTQDGDFEQLGYEILAFGRLGPLMLKKRTGAKLSYFLLFHSDRSTFPYRIGFPILISNLVEISLRQAELSEARGVSTGVLPRLALEPNQEYEVRGPDGTSVSLKSNDDSILSGVSAPHVGHYEISGGNQSSRRMGVALLSAAETKLATTQQLLFEEELSVTAADEAIKSDRPLWPILAFLGFCALLVEWWFFERRPGGFVNS